MKTAFIVLCSPEKLSQYRVLYESILKHVPNVTPILYYGGTDNRLIRGFGSALIEDISLWVAASHYKEDWYKYCSLRAKAILHAFSLGYEKVVLLGADTEFFSAPYHLTNFNTNVLLTMYTDVPYPDETLYPNNIQTIEVGQIQADCIGFRNAPEVIEYLKWLDTKLEKYMEIKEPYYKIYLDQGWFSTVFSMINDFKIIKHKGYNVGFYNMHNKGLYRACDDSWRMIDNSPLVLFHYSGFEKGKEENISKHQNRYKAEGELLEFLRNYGKRI